MADEMADGQDGDTGEAVTGELISLGRIAITWPAVQDLPNALPVWGIRIDDLEADEQLVDVVGLRMELGSEAGWSDTYIEAVLTRLVDADGKPIGRTANRLVYTDDYAAYREQRGLDRAHPGDNFPTDEFAGPKLRTGEFRYVVSEMRIAPRREPRAAQYMVGGLGPAPTAFDTEARTIAEAQGGYVPGTVETVVRAGENVLPRSMLESPEN